MRERRRDDRIVQYQIPLVLLRKLSKHDIWSKEYLQRSREKVELFIHHRLPLLHNQFIWIWKDTKGNSTKLDHHDGSL